MHTVYLFGSDYASPLALHQALKRLLDLPDYYGCNADALNDCLAELQPSLRRRGHRRRPPARRPGFPGQRSPRPGG